MPVCIALICSATFGATQKNDAKWQLDGIILDAQTNEPVEDVHVRILDQQTTSNAAGRFSLTGDKGGSGRLFGEKSGYAGLRLEGRMAIGNNGIPLSLSSGNRLTVVSHMFPAGAARGRIVDSRGESIQGANVLALYYAYDDTGIRLLKTFATEKTNDLGEFEFGNLEPGKYVFRVEPTLLNLNAEGKMYSSLYYPGVPVELNARTFPIQSGSQIQLGDLVITSLVSKKIQLKAISQDGDPVAGWVTFQRSGEMNNIRSGQMSDKGITIELPLGTYNISFSPSARTGLPKSLQHLEVANGDVELHLIIPRSVPFIGRAILKSQNDTSAIPVSGIRLQLLDSTLPAGSSADGIISGPSDLNGLFSIPTLRPGKYQLEVSGIPSGMYLAEVVDIDGRDLLLNGVDVVAGSDGNQVMVVLKEFMISIEGRVLDRDGFPVQDAVVAILPDDRSRRHLVFSATSDSTGHYNLQCPAGNYHAFSWQELEGPAYRNADFMKNYDEQGQSIPADNKSLAINLVTLSP